MMRNSLTLKTSSTRKRWKGKVFGGVQRPAPLASVHKVPFVGVVLPELKSNVARQFPFLEPRLFSRQWMCLMFVRGSMPQDSRSAVLVQAPPWLVPYPCFTDLWTSQAFVCLSVPCRAAPPRAALRGAVPRRAAP